ncbi:hypothetical protein UP10_18680 [Bradyrhizobium sp. LTSPM299]|uniref:hypothetical protein n=1 Tax=Bradyrhizobium sp. LTSPM299 TaxID=1619233 RepID=UPI0005C865EC|nr:hypothetical protein [Bradyrhizobium sp. LTSPM299]KJC59512.1 hypothetical protein UP10_18680 [Bradyrhizobium sp. LTSPM299]
MTSDTTRCSNSTAASLACAILGVCVVYIVVLDWRFPYIHQIPVFDLDYITTVMMMFARNWWIEGPWQMLFSMPYAPLSVETATPDLRYAMYQSWPPGAVLPLYLVALLTGTEPNITMVNWLNVAGHGLIALFLSLAAYFTANLLRRPRIEGVVLAIVAACLVLFPRGAVYFFSQIYAFDTHIVVYYALLLFAVALELGASNRSSARRYYWLQIAILICGLFVDWLFYFVFAVWFVLRLVGAWTDRGSPMKRKEAWALTALPLVTFAVFLIWRFRTPGSIAAKDGVIASIEELAWKLVYRIGETSDHPVSSVRFFPAFYESHRFYYWDTAPVLIGVGFVICLVLSVALLITSRTDSVARKASFGLFSMFLLSIVPAYAQMIVLKQHTYIHPWSLAKVVVPLAMVPGVFLPLMAAAVLQRWLSGWSNGWWKSVGRIAGTVGVLAFALWIGTEAWPRQTPYILGRIDPAGAVPWLTIHDMTSYRDVVFSPDFETVPFGAEAAVSGKLVYRARSFAEVDRKVNYVCGAFQVVIVHKGEDADPTFDGRTPKYVIRIGGLTLTRFSDYPGAAKGCP